MLIVAPPSTSEFAVGRWLAGRDHHPRFIRHMVPVLWRAAVAAGLDPVGVICQSGKETAFGRYGGAVKPWMRNTCGLRVHPDGMRQLELRADDPLVHQMTHSAFATWEVGAVAHVQHLVGYVGLTPTGLLVDPRFVKRDPPIRHWSELGGPGSWAPSPTYGVEVEDLMLEVQTAG